MPYKSESIKLKRPQDRRVKLSTEDKIEIKELSLTGISQRKLATSFNVSRRTISFIIDPEKLAENIKRRKERGGWKQYYNKEKWAKTMKEHRDYKQKLYKQGELNE